MTDYAAVEPSAGTLGTFAAVETPYLRARLGVASLDELAQLNIVKLAEEAGEASGAYLAWRGQQRAEKLNGSVEARLQDLGTEIVDVMVTAAVLAQAVGLDIDAALASRLAELERRRATWLAEHAGEDPL